MAGGQASPQDATPPSRGAAAAHDVPTKFAARPLRLYTATEKASVRSSRKGNGRTSTAPARVVRLTVATPRSNRAVSAPMLIGCSVSGGAAATLAVLVALAPVALLSVGHVRDVAATRTSREPRATGIATVEPELEDVLRVLGARKRDILQFEGCTVAWQRALDKAGKPAGYDAEQTAALFCQLVNAQQPLYEAAKARIAASTAVTPDA